MVKSGGDANLFLLLVLTHNFIQNFYSSRVQGERFAANKSRHISTRSCSVLFPN